jgi:hypothetical protein
MTQEITLDQFYDLLSNAYAVSVNDTLYFVGYNGDDSPYIADNDGDDYVDLSTVDGEILMDDCGVFFTIQEQPYRVQFLLLQCWDALTDYFNSQV